MGIVLTLFEIISGSADVQAADFSAPLIELPISNLHEKSASVRQIAVKVEDENGVVSVKIHYRTIGENGTEMGGLMPRGFLTVLFGRPFSKKDFSIAYSTVLFWLLGCVLKM